MKVVCVTSAFLSIRKDRPSEYYSTPLFDFLEKIMADSTELEVMVFSDILTASSLQKNGVVFEHCNPESLLSEFWKEQNWQKKYQPLKRLSSLDDLFDINGLMLLAVWLGKFAMIKKAFTTGADAVFWFDSGHWTSHQHFADFSKYSASMMSKVSGKNLANHLLSASEKYKILSTQAWPSLKELHIPLEAYYAVGREFGYKEPQKLPLYQGVFLLINKAVFFDFFIRCQAWWERLISDGYGGTEESALTIYGWERQVDRLSYNNWLKILEGRPITNNMLELNCWE